MTDLTKLTAANNARWQKAKLTRGPEFARPAAKAFANKARYVSIANRAGMGDLGWLFIACTHYRESSQDFTKNLGQGDPLDHVTTHVPVGRGPFLGPTAFEDAAVDALVNCPPYAARLTDWSIAGMLTNAERYNGLAYANAGRPSPYIWSGTDQYTTGKVLVDHGPIEDIYRSGPHKGQPVVDPQLGCAGLILAIQQLDSSVVFGTPTPAQPIAVAKPSPTQSSPAPSSTTASHIGAGTVVVATAATVQQASSSGVPAILLGVIIVVGLVCAAGIWLALHKANPAAPPTPTKDSPPQGT